MVLFCFADTFELEFILILSVCFFTSIGLDAHALKIIRQSITAAIPIIFLGFLNLSTFLILVFALLSIKHRGVDDGKLFFAANDNRADE